MSMEVEYSMYNSEFAILYCFKFLLRNHWRDTVRSHANWHILLHSAIKWLYYIIYFIRDNTRLDMSDLCDSTNED